MYNFVDKFYRQFQLQVENAVQSVVLPVARQEDVKTIIKKIKLENREKF